MAMLVITRGYISYHVFHMKPANRPWLGTKNPQKGAITSYRPQRRPWGAAAWFCSSLWEWPGGPGDGGWLGIPTWLRKDMFKWYLWGLDMRIYRFSTYIIYIYNSRKLMENCQSCPQFRCFLDFAFMQSTGTAADRAANGHCLKMVWEAGGGSGDPPPLNEKIITVHLLHPGRQIRLIKPPLKGQSKV